MTGVGTKITIKPGGKVGNWPYVVRSGKIPLLLAVSITDVPSFENNPRREVHMLISKVLNGGDRGDSLL